MNINRRHFKWWVSAILCVIVTLITIAYAKSDGWEVQDTLLTGVLMIFSYLLPWLILFIYDIYLNNTSIEKVLLKLNNNFNSKYNNLIELVALHTDDNSLERRLDLLKRKQGGIKWIIAKFISKQISSNFRRFGFHINSEDYSLFSNKLYNEAEKSIYLTNSLNPFEWFKALIPKSEFEVVSKQIKNNISIPDRIIPSHIIAWINLAKSKTNIKRRRIVIMSEKEINSLFAYRSFFEEYIRINDAKNDNMRFVTAEDLSLKFPKIDFQNFDYAIYDEEIVLEWEVSDLSSSSQFVKLFDLKNDNDPKIYFLIDFIEYFINNWGKLKTIEDLRERIEQKLTNLNESIKSKGIIDHKYCYYSLGAESWKKINTDSSYHLGLREQKFLKNFLHEIVNKKLEIKNYDIVHLGSGSGIEINTIINNLDAININNYKLIDISTNMLERAKEQVNFIKEYDLRINNISFDYQCEDILLDNWHFKSSDIPKLFFLVCNGFLLSHDSLLTNLHRIMNKEDYLIVTTESQFFNNEQIISSYKTKSVLELFNISLNLIDIDSTSQSYYNFEFEEDLFKGYFDLKKYHKDQNKKIIDTTYDRLQFFQSYKPRNVENIRKRLKNIGLQISESFVNEDFNSIGILIKKVI